VDLASAAYCAQHLANSPWTLDFVSVFVNDKKWIIRAVGGGDNV
jgi:hypothetical protein